MFNRGLLGRILIAVCLIGAVVLMPGCSEEVKAYADPEKTVETSAGKEFVINLEANPTTGYSWQEAHDGTMLKLVDENYKQNNTNTPVVGAGGITTYRFQALKPGTTEITFTYKRPWETEFDKQMTFEVTVK